MQLVRTMHEEMIRVLKNKGTVLLFCLVVVLNALLLMVYSDHGHINGRAYKAIKTQIFQLSPDERISFLENKMEQLYQEETNQLYEEQLEIEGYASYLDSVKERAEQERKVSVFGHSTFSVNNIDKTEADYGRLQHIVPELSGGYGLTYIMQFRITDILLVVLLCYFVFVIILDDKKSGMLELLKTTRNGGAVLGAGKLLVLQGCSIFSTIILFGLNFLYAWNEYGAVDFTLPVQSLPGFSKCVYMISIGQCLVSYLFIKCMVAVLISSFLYLLAAFFKNHIYFFAGILGAILMSLSFFLLGKYVGFLSVFRTCNLIYFACTDAMIGTYLNYNVFGQACSMLYVNLVVMLLMIALFVPVNVCVFKKYANDYKKINLRTMYVNRHPSKKLIFAENYKVLYGQKVFFLILISIIVMYGIYHNKDVRWGYAEAYYKLYMEELEGEITKEKEDFLASEQTRVEKAEQQLLALEALYSSGQMVESEYQNQSSELLEQIRCRDGLNLAMEYCAYIKDLPMENKGYVYNRGWNYLAGGNTYKNDMMNAVLFVVFIILGMAGLLAQEYQYQMNFLIRVSVKRRHVMLCKFGIVVGLVTLFFSIVYLPEVIWVLREYGLSHGQYQLQCLHLQRENLMNASISQYFVLVYLVRYLAGMVIAVATAFIGKVTKNTNYTIMIASILFLLPLIIHVLGLEAVDNWSMNAFLSGNMLFN